MEPFLKGTLSVDRFHIETLRKVGNLSWNLLPCIANISKIFDLEY